MSPAFAALERLHADVLDAWGRGADSVDLIAQCLELALPIDQRLGQFYTACLARPEDFRARAPIALVD